MSERRDYIALEWVAGEIRETLALGSQALESYIGNRDDISKLRFCLTHVHQVQGTLTMVEFFGAALLAEEIEAVVNALLLGDIHDSHIDDALFVLRYSIRQLPLYLERVRESRHGLPATLIPILNDLRSVRGESLLSETALFVPDLSAQSTVNETQTLAVTGVELEEVAHKLRQMFQIALLGLIRNRDIKKNVNYLAKVCARLTKLTSGCLSQPLWKICIAVLEGVLNGSIDASVSIKILLRQVDRELKLIIDNGESALLSAPPENLVKNLLYYVACSKANSRYIEEVRKEYSLEASLLGTGELEAGLFEAPDGTMLRSVGNTLCQELSVIGNKINSAKTDISMWVEVLPCLRRVYDAMAVLDMAKPLKFVREVFSDIAKQLAIESAIDTHKLEEFLTKISSAKASFNLPEIRSGIKEKEEDSFSVVNASPLVFDHAFDNTVRESRRNLEEIKEAIIEFVATQWNHHTLNHLPRLLDDTYERLAAIPLPIAANIIRSCSAYVSQDILHYRQVPEWQKLDTLADAITSIDYYLERLLDDARSESAAILELAAESAAELGYPVQLLAEEGKNNDDHLDSVEALENKPEVVDPELSVSSDVPLLDEPEFIEESSENIALADIPVLTQVAVDSPQQDTAVNENDIADEDEVDPEIVEIFVEEAGEVLEAIAEFLPQWKMIPSDEEARLTVKRAFHTLKGSGKMVGASDIADLAWSIENMLNRISDGTIAIDDIRFSLIDEVVERVPGLVSAFELKQSVTRPAIEHLIHCATILSNEQTPTEPLNFQYEPTAENAVLEFSVQGSPEEQKDSVIDSELIEIFLAESTGHAKVLESFISHCEDLAGPAELSDELQRALHTLKGSANMAGITPIAKIVTPIERLIRELRARQIKVDTQIVGFLATGLNLITAGISQLRSNPLGVIPGAAEYIDLIEKICDERLDFQSGQGFESRGIPPEALNNFLGDSLDILSGVSDRVSEYQKTGSSAAELRDCGNDIEKFVERALAVNLSAPAEMATEVARFYAKGAACETVNSDFFLLAQAGNDALIDMLDQIAGHQNPVVDSTILSGIQYFQFLDDRVDDITAPENNAESQLFSGDVGVGEAISLNSDNPNSPVLPASVEAVYGELVDTIYQHEDEGNSESDLIDLDKDPYVEEDFGRPESEGGLELQFESPVLGANSEELDAEPRFESKDELQGNVDADVDAEILEIFLDEADDLLEDLDSAIHRLGQNRDEKSALNELLRTLHTLKGGARMAGLVTIGDLSHNFETSLIKADNENAVIGDDFYATIQRSQDILVSQISAVKTASEVNIAGEADFDREALAVSKDVGETLEIDSGSLVAGEIQVDDVEEDTVVEDKSLQHDQQEGENTKSIAPITPIYKSLDRPPEKLNSSASSGQQEMVKVSAQLLEELVNLAGETSISRGRAEEQMSELVFSLDEMQITVERLQEQVRRLDMETEQQILYRQEQVESEGLEEFDPLEMDRYSQLQQLSRSLLESSSDLVDIKNTLSDKSRDMETLLVQQSRINTDLQEGLLRSRMVPFQRMVPRLRRIIRQVSNELGKNVELQLDNVEGELDRAVLERMIVPLEHMLRNAVDHGIEESSVRAAAGKPATGTISLDLSREGGEIVLRLSDDGGGINLDRIKEKAIERGAMDADANLTDHEILQFILHSGISTAAAITQISGRGVGMDVVNSEIKQLGGSMEIQSELGVGTRFIVRLPFTVSVNRALMVSVAGDIYAIPLNTIEGIVRVSPYELDAYYQPDAPMFEYAGQPYVMRYMGSLLQRGDKPNLEGQSMPLPVLLARGAEHAVAIQVDSLMGSREIVVKPLGPQFSQVQGVSGATVLGDGSVVVILDLLAMIRADLSHVHRGTAKNQHERIDEKSVLVMVVDDSVTVRKVMSRFLERQGMEVLLAKDGIDAVTQLSEIERLPDVMLLDIEMPRMDGFEVASRVRHTSRIKNLPIIMITSRTGDKHRDRAFSLGVDEYLGKPYQESELLESIFRLTGVEVE